MLDLVTQISIDWNALGALAAAGAALTAAFEIFRTRRDANRRATLEFLRAVDERLRPLWSRDVPAIRAEVLACYRGAGGSLTEGGLQYLSFLNTLDMLGFALRHRLVDRNAAVTHARTLVRPEIITSEFLQELQAHCGDACVYEDLTFLIEETKKMPERPKPSSPPPPKPPAPPPPRPTPPQPPPPRSPGRKDLGFPPPPPPSTDKGTKP